MRVSFAIHACMRALLLVRATTHYAAGELADLQLQRASSLQPAACRSQHSRLVDPNGDRFELHELFKGASVLNPSNAKKLSREEAMDLLEKLRVYPALNKSGDDNIVNKLKKGFHAYKQKCMLVSSKFDYSSNHSAILTWQYRNFLHLDSEWKNDSKRGRSCRYCSATGGKCKCSSNLEAY